MRISKVTSITTALLIISSVISGGATPAQAAAKAGASCKKAGSTEAVGSKKFTCVKSGKKLVWNKGVTVGKPNQAATKPQTATPAPAAPAIAEPVRATSFSDIAANAEGIRYWAWKLGTEKVKENSASAFKVRELIGPNSASRGVNSQLVMGQASKLFGKFSQPAQVNVIMYNYKDVEWAQQQYAALSPAKSGGEMLQGAAHNCRTAETCWGASVDFTTTGEGIVLLTVDKLMSNDKNHTSGTLQTHEYAHIVMLQQLKNMPNADRASASWFWEGVATYAQAVGVYAGDYDYYQREINRVIADAKSNREIQESWLMDYLSSTTGDWGYWQKKSDNWHLYDIGVQVAEALVVVGGTDSLMEVFKQVGEGASFDNAFATVYKTSWNEAMPAIAKTIAKMMNK